MPTSSQCNIRGQEAVSGAKGTPSSSKSNKCEKIDLQKAKSHIQRHNHHQSDPSLNAKLHSEGKIESPLPKTPVRGNVLHRSRSIPSLHDKNFQMRSEEKGKDAVQKCSNGLPKLISGDRTPISQYATPRRSGAQRTKQPLPSNHKQCSDNPQRHSLKSFSCEINLKLSATPDCYNKVHMETPLRKEELGNLSGLVEAETSNLTVGVRVRPLNFRESSDSNIMNVVSVVGNEVTVKCDTGMLHTFVYDHCFLSDQPEHPQYAYQDTVFSTMVEPLLEKMFEGYNACLFAYGQTGSGKSYSMMGVDADMESTVGKEAGIIPRFCHKLFDQITSKEGSPTASTTVEISYFEIYNEKIHDLLGGSTDPGRRPLKVREHPVFGPYVEDLSVHGVTSFEDLKGWLKVGNSQRATAATGMNEKSSRSHSIFSVILTQTEEEEVLEEHHVHTKRSKINLVDLAGSERISHSCVSGDRLREGVSINRSLLTLGKVISALSDNVNNKKKGFVPYRDSVLTWLLRESLGGNSRTAMLATVSPSSAHAEETLATLRYACQARTIVNRVRAHEDPSDRLIRELRAEVDRLTALKEVFEHQKKHPLCDGDSGMSQEIHRKEQEIHRLKEQLKQSQEYLSKSDRSWSERLQEAEKRKSAELKYLKQCGLAVHLDWKEQQPCLVNLTADPILSGTLFYLLPPGIVQIGRQINGVEDGAADICLSGPLVRRKHCTIQNLNGNLSLSPGSNGQTFVNGKIVNAHTILHHGDRVVIGGNHYFRVNHPQDSMGKVIDHPIDYQFAYQEIHRIQESKLQAELEEAKRNALIELEETRKEAEKQLGSQRSQFEDQLQQLGTTLEMHKDALSEISRKKEQLEIEKHVLQAEVESHKARRAHVILEDSFLIAPYKTNFLQEVEDILNGTLTETETILRSNSNGGPEPIGLHDMQVMIQEAKELCKDLGIPYDFSHEHIVGECALQQRVKVKDISNYVTAFWKPSYFSHWLDRIRHHDPGDCLKELLKHDHVEWMEDLETSGSEDNSRIMVNTKNVKRQLNESILQLSMESCDSVMGTECESIESDSLDDNLESICNCIDQMENNVQDLRILCDGQNKEVGKKLCALDTIIKDLKAVLQISNTMYSEADVNESSHIFKFPDLNTPPAKSNLRSPGPPGQDTPKVAKSVRFFLSESQQNLSKS